MKSPKDKNNVFFKFVNFVLFLPHKQTCWSFLSHSQGCNFVKFPHCLWRSMWMILESMPIHFTCPSLQVCFVPVLRKGALHLGPPLHYSPHCLCDTCIFGLHDCLAHPLLFQQFQNAAVSFPSLSQFSLFIGKHFWLFSGPWLLADGLIGSAGKFEQFSVFTSVPSLGTGSWQAADFLLFGRIYFLKQYNLYHLPWSNDQLFPDAHRMTEVGRDFFLLEFIFPVYARLSLFL